MVKGIVWNIDCIIINKIVSVNEVIMELFHVVSYVIILNIRIQVVMKSL